jgi:hypothetical protein
MYIDIAANENVDEAAMATFKETGSAVPVRAVRLHLDDGWHWCAITGWAPAGPVAASITPIEESGDGPARLVHGGDHGLRLARIPAPAASATVRWDLGDPAQWGEPFLLCRPETEFT